MQRTQHETYAARWTKEPFRTTQQSIGSRVSKTASFFSTKANSDRPSEVNDDCLLELIEEDTRRSLRDLEEELGRGHTTIADHLHRLGKMHGFRRCARGQILTNLRCFHFSSILPKIVHYKLSDIGEGIAEVQLKEWHVNIGDKVSEFDEICTVQSDKAAVTITSRYSGLIKKLHYEVEDIAKVGDVLIDIDDEAAETVVDKDEIVKLATEPPTHVTELQVRKKILATPAVRRLISENNVDMLVVNGTGRDGRILKEDILRHIHNGAITLDKIFDTDSTANESRLKVQKAQESASSHERAVPIRGYTRTMIKSMTEALKIPHFGYNDEFVVDKLMQLRKELNELRGDRPKISYMPLVIKATSIALNEFSVLNSSIDANVENLIYKKYHNISLAMDTPGGLVVPNIKNCESKSIWQIAADLQRLSELGQKQMLPHDDLINGTFTLSNIGAIGGGTYMKPVIFPPQVAIGAIGRIQHVTYWDAKTNAPKPQSVLHFSWAADHRVVDGATMARFSNRLKQLIEQPALMVGELS